MADLTISQALRKIKDIKGRLSKHQENAKGSVLYLEKDKPAYSFKSEVESADSLGRDLLRHQTAVAVANATTAFDWEGRKVLLTWAVKRLEELKGAIKWHNELSVSAQADKVDEAWEYAEINGRTERVKTERKWKCELPEAERAKRVQSLQDEFNRLNDQVETINHRTSVKLDG